MIMENYYCLTKNEVENFLFYIQNNNDLIMPELLPHIQEAEYWEKNLILFLYFLAQILEKNNKKHLKTEKTIDKVYEIEDRLSIELEPFNREFIDYIMQFPRNDNLDLQEDIIYLKHQHKEYDYQKTICR